MANQNPANNLTEEARRKGGQNSPGNFKNDPQRAAEAGRKSHSGGSNSGNK
jgi:general stress protein YciG